MFNDDEEFSVYSERTLKHLMLIARVNRLHRIYQRYCRLIIEMAKRGKV